MRARLRLLPLALVGAVLLVLAKAERMVATPWTAAPEPVRAAVPPQPAAPPRPSPMAALAQPATAQPAQAQQPTAQPPSPPPPPAPEAVAERAVLEALRARRAEIDARQQAAAQREQMVTAAERRLAQRVEELVALQARLETLERERAQREEAGLRGLVRLYEGMRPRDAAAIFDELDMPVLLPIVDRMREARAAPVMAAMRPERARALTAEIAKLRAERVDQERSTRAAAR
jgi:flagellar motility protein MotE (MotC chaperone)